VLFVYDLTVLSEIRGSNSGVAKEYSVPGYGSIPLGVRFLTSRKTESPSSSGSRSQITQ